MAFANALFVSKRLQLAVAALLCLAAGQLIGAATSPTDDPAPPASVTVPIDG